MKIINKKTSDLIPYDNNPRNNDEAVEMVANSIKEFGFKVPIIITGKNQIVAGHTRLKASIKLGLETVPCIIADDLTEEQIKAFRLADNKVSEIATWDMEKLEQELGELRNLDFDMEMFGFDTDLFQIENEAEEDNYDAEETYENIDVPFSIQGDIWCLGNHRLMCGDSTSEDDVAALVNGETIDLLMTDPPYNVDYGSKAEAINEYGYQFSDRNIKNDCMSNEDFEEFLSKTFKCVNNHLKEGGAFYIWHASITVLEFEKALRKNGLKTRQQLIWNKNSMVLSRQDYHWKHEPCLYGWKEGAAHYFVDDRTQTTVYDDTLTTEDFKKMKKNELLKLLEEIYADKISTTVINENKPSRSELHPMMKPIKLMARLIKNSSKRNEKVLDLFGGSGSTLIACEQIDRINYSMELDEKYVDVIVDRYKQLRGSENIYLIREGKKIKYEDFN